MRHLDTLTYSKTRVINVELVPAKKLGDIIAHEVSDPDNLVSVKKNGLDVRKFKCPLCTNLRVWAHRFDHAFICYPKNGRGIGPK